jgi:hypothetical protein
VRALARAGGVGAWCGRTERCVGRQTPGGAAPGECGLLRREGAGAGRRAAEAVGEPAPGAGAEAQVHWRSTEQLGSSGAGRWAAGGRHKRSGCAGAEALERSRRCRGGAVMRAGAAGGGARAWTRELVT